MTDTTPPDWMIEGTLASAERAAIIAALAYCNYSRTLTAKRLRCGRATLYRMVAEFQIEMQPPPRPIPAPRPDQHNMSQIVVLNDGQYILIKKREPAQLAVRKADR